MTGNTITLQNVGMAFDKGIKNCLLRGLNLKIYKSGDGVTQSFMIDLDTITANDTVFFKSFNSCSGGR